jgi:FixJ family two-component response regulator
VDYQLSGSSGLDLVREAINSGSSSPWILATGSSQPDVDVKAMNAGAADYLGKADLSASLLSRSIRYALLRQRTSLQSGG